MVIGGTCEEKQSNELVSLKDNDNRVKRVNELLYKT
jgi:hypothetical protein